MLSCKYCRSGQLVKNGIVLGKQRYKCKDCVRTFREGDARVVHDIKSLKRIL